MTYCSQSNTLPLRLKHKTRGGIFAASNTPGNHACLNIGERVSFALTDQRAASVTLACVLPSDPTSADEGVVKLEPSTESSSPQRVLALLMAHNRQVDLLQHDLVLASCPKLILAPTCGKAVLPIELLLGLWKADGVDVLLQLKWLSGVEERPIVGKIP